MRIKKTRRKACDDANGWLCVFRYPFIKTPLMDVRWYKTFSGASKAARDHQKICAMQPRMKGGTAFVVSITELERWHVSSGVDELERMFSL